MRYIAVILCFLMLSLGCKTTSKSVKETHTSTRDSISSFDSTAISNTDVHKEVEITNHRTERDSVFGIPAKNVADSINKKDLELPRTKTGTAVPRRFEKKEDGVRAWAVIDTNGNLLYGCDVDSITFVVKNLIRENNTIRSRYDSLASVLARTKEQVVVKYVEVSTKDTKIVKEKNWWGRNWKLLVVLVVAVVLITVFKWWNPILSFIKKLF